MTAENVRGNKPLELSGTGLLQVLQIFSYLYLFRPKVILIDEPEAHLHPPLQTRLLEVLQDAVKECGSTALITTHSPFIAAGLAEGAQTVWLERGRIAATTRTGIIRDALGWGALDKKIIVCAEDRDTRPLEMILGQDDKLRREVAIVPFSGVSKLGSGEALEALRASLGSKHKVAVYRDRDCLTDTELEQWATDYSKRGFICLTSTGLEIENEFCEPRNIAGRLGIDIDRAESIYKSAISDNLDVFKAKFRDKRRDANSRFNKDGGSPNTDDLWKEWPLYRTISGKMLLSKINTLVDEESIPRLDLRIPTEGVTIGAQIISRLRRLSAGDK